MKIYFLQNFGKERESINCSIELVQEFSKTKY